MQDHKGFQNTTHELCQDSCKVSLSGCVFRPESSSAVTERLKLTSTFQVGVKVSVLFTHHSAVRWRDDTAVERDEAAAYEGLEEAGKTECYLQTHT